MTTQHRLHAEAESLAAPFPPLLAEAQRVAASVNIGVHGRRRPGIGETFWEYRSYRAGDSASLIDWRSSARTDRLFVRENEWEIANTVWVWRDGSDTMDYASSNKRPSKLHRASVLALALAVLLNRGGERIGLLGASDRAEYGGGAVRRMAERLAANTVGDLPDQPDVQRDARIVLIGDFLRPLDDLTQKIRRYARASAQGCLVQVLDPAESEFPFAGRTIFQNMSGADEMLFGRAQSVRSEYRRREEAHRAALFDLAREIGWQACVHWTNHSPQTALLTLYEAIAGDSRPKAEHG